MIDLETNAPSDHRRTMKLKKAWKQLGEWAKSMDAQPLQDIEYRLRRIEAKLAVLEHSQSLVEVKTTGPPTLE
jgi:hypothetical protein